MYSFDDFDKLVEMTGEELLEQKRNEYLWDKGIEAQIFTSKIACVSTDVILQNKTKEEAYDAIIEAYHYYLDRITESQKRIDEKYEKINSYRPRT